MTKSELQDAVYLKWYTGAPLQQCHEWASALRSEGLVGEAQNQAHALWVAFRKRFPEERNQNQGREHGPLRE